MPAEQRHRAARAVRALTRPRGLVTRLTRAHAAVLRHSGGRLRRSVLFAGGQPVLALTTTGRRTGVPRSTVVAYLEQGDAYAVFGVNLGSEHDPSWCLNLAAQPRATVEVAGRRVDVRARRAAGDEAERLWRAYAARTPPSEAFREISGREIPIFVLEPS